MPKRHENIFARLGNMTARLKGNERVKRLLRSFYRDLLAHFGHRSWWPADSPFEVCVGAILAQNTSWKNVVKAMDNLKAVAALDPFRLHEMTHEELAALIVPAGYYNVKARRLGNFVAHLVEAHHGDLASLFSSPVDALRRELLSVNGIGKETADSMILYAANKPIFVVDAYTGRVLKRHGMISENASYDDIQEVFHANLPRETDLFNDFHAQLVAVGHHYCKRVPKCTECPLKAFLYGPVKG